MNKTEWEETVAWVGVVAGCIIEKDGKYLMVQEAQKKVYGLWNIPAGHVDRNESIEDAAVREAREETGYIVKLLKEVAVIHENEKSPVKHIFSAEITGGNLIAQEGEILDARWLTIDEIESLHKQGKLRALWIWDLIQKDIVK